MSSLIHYPVYLTVTLLTNNSAFNNFRSVQADWSVITNISTQSASDNSSARERSRLTVVNKEHQAGNLRRDPLSLLAPLPAGYNCMLS